MNRTSVRTAVLQAVFAAAALSSARCASPVVAPSGSDASAAREGGAVEDVASEIAADATVARDGAASDGEAGWSDGAPGPAWDGSFAPGCEPVRTQRGSTCPPALVVLFPCGIPQEWLWTSSDGGHYVDPAGGATMPPNPETLQRCQSICAAFGRDVANGAAPTCAFYNSSERIYGAADDGGVVGGIQCGTICAGRALDGVSVVESPADVLRERDSFARYLAECARLEAIAVVAFEHLADELARLNAPVDLIERAKVAAVDERRHTDAMRSLAAARNAPELAFSFEPPSDRSLFALALENRVEGCVRETFGAALAAYQAEHAEDQGLRAALPAIAVEELSHAQWSWDLDDWLQTQLTTAQRAALDRAQVEAIDALRAETTDPTLIARAGMPGPAAAHAMVAQLRASLWSAPASA